MAGKDTIEVSVVVSIWNESALFDVSDVNNPIQKFSELSETGTDSGASKSEALLFSKRKTC